jgi:hypothetical protein
MKQHLMFFVGVAISLMIINNVSFLRGIVFANYTGTTTTS